MNIKRHFNQVHLLFEWIYSHYATHFCNQWQKWKF